MGISLESQFLQDSGLKKIYEKVGSLGVANKLGGDNMALLEPNLHSIQMMQNLGIRQSYAVSAFRSSTIDFNTTSKLIQAGDDLNKTKFKKVLFENFYEVADFHYDLIDTMLQNSPNSIRKELLKYTKGLFREYEQSLRSAIFDTSESVDYLLTAEYWNQDRNNVSLLALGEVIAAKVMEKFLQLHEITARYVDTENIGSIHPTQLSQVSLVYLQDKLHEIYSEKPEAVPIIPGYIGSIQGGILDILGRGYTDYTGERSSIAMEALNIADEVVLYIQKMYGFKTTDPNKLTNKNLAESVDTMSYDLAQLAISKYGAGAGLINQFALSNDIRSKAIKILVGNPTDSNDVSVIKKSHSDKVSQGVGLILPRGVRSGDKKDARNLNIYPLMQAKKDIKNARVVEGGEHIDPRTVVYLTGENLGKIGDIYKQASGVLGSKYLPIAYNGNTSGVMPYLAFIFEDEKIAHDALQVLHKYFIEDKNEGNIIPLMQASN